MSDILRIFAVSTKNGMKRFLTAAAVSAVTVLAVSCAKERTSDTNEAAKRYFDAWVTVQKETHPEYLWEKTGNGVYLLEDEQIEDGDIVTDSSYVFVYYVYTDLEGNILWDIGSVYTSPVYELTLFEDNVYAVFANGNAITFTQQDAAAYEGENSFADSCRIYSLGVSFNTNGNVKNTQVLVSESGEYFYLRGVFNDISQINRIYRVRTDGEGIDRIAATSNTLGGMALDTEGNLYYSMRSTVYCYSAEGTVSTLQDVNETVVALSYFQDSLSMITAQSNLFILSKDGTGSPEKYKLSVTLSSEYLFSTGENFVGKINNGGVAMISSEERAVTLTMRAADSQNLIMWTDESFVLYDVSDVNNPLLQELSEKCPGTFQHSVQVSNLASEATKEIGANYQLARAGALYHDIGKIANPLCFIENEAPGTNYHEELTPIESAREIIKHVSDGLAIADKAGLPDVVKDFILTHHGTTCTAYFYNKYLEAGGDPAKADDFYYKGRKPWTKEQSILMLCDTIEAASRSLKDFSQQSVSDFVDRIFNSKVRDGQFEEADISLKELHILKNVLKDYLQQVHHARVVYPKRQLRRG